VGRVGSVSSMGCLSGSPYTAAVEEKTIRFTPVSPMASSSEIPPPTLFRKYLPGLSTDSPTRESAAMWTTASIRRRARTPRSLSVSATSPTIRLAPWTTAPRCPL
jgi:hypothetical protein